MLKSRFLVLLLLAAILIILMIIRPSIRNLTTAKLQNSPLPSQVKDTTVKGNSISKGDIHGDPSVSYGLFTRQTSSSQPLLTGRILSDSHLAISGATVKLYSIPQLENGFPKIVENEWPDALYSVLSDVNGTYTVELDGPVDNSVLVVHMAGYATIEDFPDLKEAKTIRKDYQLQVARGCIDVNVVDDVAKPVGGAEIIAVGNMSQFIPDRSLLYRIVRSNNSGKYSLSDLPEGLITVTAFAPHLFHSGEAINVSAGPCRPLTVRLRAAKKLTFRIKNTMGATIPDASLLSANGFVRAKADNNGKMEVLFPAEANAMDCTVYARGYIAHSFSLDPTDSVQELVLEKAAEFSGSVVSETGAPIEGAVVTVIGSGGRTGAAAKVKTNTAGWFSIFPASPPVVSIKVAKDGYMERQIGIDPKPTIDKVSIVLEKTRSGFFGRVFLSNGEPAHQFVMAIANSNNKGQLFVRHVEDADGSFQISDIPLGTYHVTIKVAKPFEVGEIKDLELREGSYFGPIEVKLSAYLARKKIG